MDDDDGHGTVDLTPPTPKLPSQLWHVEAWVSFGHPEPTRREHLARNYTSERGAARQVVHLRHPPGRHQLLGVWHTTTNEWADVRASIEELADTIANDDEEDQQ